MIRAHVVREKSIRNVVGENKKGSILQSQASFMRLSQSL